MAKPVKRRIQGGRVTPKGGPQPGAHKQPVAHKSHGSAARTPDASTRYTPPIPKEMKVSPTWVPVLMFTFLGLGILMIFANYAGIMPTWGFLPDDTSNWYLFGGLFSIFCGIMVATQYH